MSTLQIINNMIVINIIEDPEDFDNGEKQKYIISISKLEAININYTAQTITLYLGINAMSSFPIDFNRGEVSEHISLMNFNAAVAQLGG